MPYTDAEKQIRFRKKEALIRESENIFRNLQLSFGPHLQPKNPQEIRHALDKAIELPSGWSDEDLALAFNKITRIYHDFVSMPDQLKNDVEEGSSSSARFRVTPDPTNFLKEEKAALEKTRALSSHIISALNISSCTDAEKAAAIMEAVRVVGRGVANQREVPKSAATAFCLAGLGPHYERPKWFAKRLSKYLKSHISRNTCGEIGNQLINIENSHEVDDESLP